MDLLSEILNLMKLSGTLYFRTAFTAPWGVEVPSYASVSRFHYVHRGRCFARIDGLPDPVRLDQGDLIIITRGASHILSDPPEIAPMSLDKVVEESGFTGRGALVHGEAGTGYETQLICGHFAFDRDAKHVLFESLPAYIHIRDYGEISPDWLEETLKIIGAEAGQNRLGADLIALKLSEIIFTQAIRKFLSGKGSRQPGLAGFADQRISRALQAMHSEPARNWSVEDLAQVAGLSRTSFSNRFGELIAISPLTYLTQWRMQLARKLLTESDLPIVDVAERSGYQSEASFGRIFKRTFDQPPAGYRRTRQNEAVQ